MTAEGEAADARGAASPRADGRRTKYTLLASIVILAAVSLAAATQNWFSLSIVDASGDASVIDSSGTVAAPALTALTLASVALAGALSIAGRVLRVVLGVLQVLIGVSIALSAGGAIAEPVRVSGSLISTSTGIAGTESIASLVSSVEQTAWPVITFVVAVLMIVVGLGVIISSGRWPGSRSRRSSRFETASAAVAGGYGSGVVTTQTEDGEIDPVATWDEQSRGDDPTS